MYNNFHGQFSPEVDRIIRESYFPDYSYKGVFIDIGACWPQFLNNSYHFEQNGWDCYLFEPNPEYFKMLSESRKNVFQYAISNEDKTNIDFNVVSLYLNDSDPNNMSAGSSLRSNPEIIKQQASLYHLNSVYNIKVTVRCLDSVLANELQHVKKVDVLSIDTEGTEIDVLKGFDLEKYQPKVIVAENNFRDPEIYQYLNGQGYVLDKSVEVNDFYLRTV
jgi:FkbM family methyltransferase